MIPQLFYLLKKSGHGQGTALKFNGGLRLFGKTTGGTTNLLTIIENNIPFYRNIERQGNLLQLTLQKQINTDNLTKGILSLKAINNLHQSFYFDYNGLLYYLFRVVLIGQSNFLTASSSTALQNNQRGLIYYYVVSFVLNVIRRKIIYSSQNYNPVYDPYYRTKYWIRRVIHNINICVSGLNILFLISTLEEYLLSPFKLGLLSYMKTFSFEINLASELRTLFENHEYANLIDNYLLSIQPYMIPLIGLYALLFNTTELMVMILVCLYLMMKHQVSLSAITTYT